MSRFAFWDACLATSCRCCWPRRLRGGRLSNFCRPRAGLTDVTRARLLRQARARQDAPAARAGSGSVARAAAPRHTTTSTLNCQRTAAVATIPHPPLPQHARAHGVQRTACLLLWLLLLLLLLLRPALLSPGTSQHQLPVSRCVQNSATPDAVSATVVSELNNHVTVSITIIIIPNSSSSTSSSSSSSTSSSSTLPTFLRLSYVLLPIFGLSMNTFWWNLRINP